ncbi:BTAD domain-containing putative transcriptional regulator [Phytoactinopolyspora limicola]|uniref:BTAD domain-containing putative transcriptional regulator n=1 Tax=Phytoactinopolyspora limicola TaxID=2715536 RepID=UPI0014073308|nr:BTAD domain-containing putative transcriptional regulator [Phytoactinopolyspora limicola]
MSQYGQPPPPPPPHLPAGVPAAVPAPQLPVGHEPREIGPQRFQRGDDSGPPRRSLMQALVAGFALLVLVVGVPVGLLALAGAPPVPTSWPTRDDLTSTIGADQLIGVLLWIVWLAWLQFAICVLVELRSAVRGIGLPSRVPMAGASQRLARVLVGSVLLAATAVGQASAAVPATPADAPATVGMSVSSLADTDGTAAVSVEAAEQTSKPAPAPEVASGDAIYRLGDMVLDADEGAELLGHKVYVVRPPEGRYHDNLWDIAERTLGDGRRYQEIFELNRGRVQPDGHELSLARLIYPNWLLILPDDAAGAESVTVEAAESVVADESAGTGAGQDASGQDTNAAGDSLADGETVAGGTERDVVGGEQTHADTGTSDQGISGGSREISESRSAGAADAGGDGSILTSPYRDLVMAGLLAAGLLGVIETVRRRRRTPEPGDDEVEAEVALRVGADPGRARWLDHALRSLAASCRDAGLALPGMYAAVVDDATVELVLAPARTDAPEPWEVHEDGRRWILRRESVVGADATAPADVLAPFPGLVSVGRDGDRDVLIDLEAAGGPISVVGDPTVAFEVVTAIAVELATNQWSDHLRVTAEGLPDELSVFDPSRLRLVTDVDAVLPELAARRVDGLGPDVLTGRLRPGGGGAWMPEYLVLGTQPGAGLAGQLRALTGAASRSPLGVVYNGDVAGARWRLSVDSSGTLEIPALGLSVRANQLSWRSIEAIAGLVEPERGGGDGPDGPVLHEAWLPEVRPAVPQPPILLDVAHLATAPVRVFVLGPVEVQTGNEIDDERRALATEMVVYLALHPDGVHPTVLAAALWPRGVTAAVREAAFGRVRDWLGTDPDGSPYLLLTEDGKLRLSSDVVLDWDVVCGLLQRAREAGSVKEEIDLLRQALRVARGPVLAERPPGRYAWIARARLERVASDVLVDAAHRLSMLSGDGGDPATSAAAARAGLRVRPGEQLLWRDLLHAQQAGGDAAGVIGAAEEMSAMLTGLGIGELEPETAALVDELLPGGDGSRSGHHRRDLA